MRKAAIVIFFVLSIVLANATENESAEDVVNTGDLPLADSGQTIDEAQVEISNSEDIKASAIDSAVDNIEETMPETSPVNEQASEDPEIQSGKRPVTAGFGVYLNIVG